MADLIDEYEVYLERERHASANTVCSYVRDVRQFDGYLRAPEGRGRLWPPVRRSTSGSTWPTWPGAENPPPVWPGAWPP